MQAVRLVQSQQKICTTHAERLQIALSRLNNLIPFDLEKLNNLNAEQLAFLELLTNRFAKLQDAIGSKIFPLALELWDEQDDISKKPFIDILNRLEKIGLLPSVKHWRDMREARNYVTEDFSENSEIMVKNLNQAIIFIQDLLQYWESLHKNLNILIEKYGNSPK